MSRVTWIWPLTQDEADYIAERDLTLCFPPGQPVELEVLPDAEEDQ